MYKQQYLLNGNWMINLSVLLCNINIIISCIPNNGSELPHNWPEQWNNGVIPYAFNYFSMSPNRLIGLVEKGLARIEMKSCLRFKLFNPKLLTSRPNFTYLYYTYSGVLESCCLQFFSKPLGKRLVLITPVCNQPAEVAHATLHGLGLTHQKHDPILEDQANAVLFPAQCQHDNMFIVNSDEIQHSISL